MINKEGYTLWLYMTCLHYWISQSEHRGMTWINYITDTSIINIRVQYIRYTSEYILKLQIHEHSLLTRKVFSRNNLSTKVFFFVSSGSSSSHIHLQVIFIFKSSSSSSHLHQVWIITGSSSSLDHQWFIITRASSSMDHYWIILGHHHRYFH